MSPDTFISVLSASLTEHARDRRRANLSPKVEALAYRIHAHASDLGWNVSLNEIAKALDVSTARARRTMHLKGWLHRIRRNGRARQDTTDSYITRTVDGDLDAIAAADVV